MACRRGETAGRGGCLADVGDNVGSRAVPVPDAAMVAHYETDCPSCGSRHSVCLPGATPQVGRRPLVEYVCPTSGVSTRVYVEGDAAIHMRCLEGMVVAHIVGPDE